MTGGGRGLCNPYGFNAGALPYRNAGWIPYYVSGVVNPHFSREKEIEYLKNQTEEIKRQISDIEKRMNEFKKR